MVSDAATMIGPGGDATRRFTAGPVERRKVLVERVAAWLLGSVTVLLVLPLIAILATLLAKAWPVLS